MSSRRMKYLLGGVLPVFALTACAMDQKPPLDPLPPFEDAAGPSAQQLCEVTALAEERKSAISTVEGASTDGWEEGQTFLSNKLERYEARMEIAYRSMVSSCNLYANCLDRNDGVESSCNRSGTSYDKARGQFFAMVSEADRLAAEIEVNRLKAVAAQANAAAARSRAEADKRKKEKPAKESSGGDGCKPDCATTGNIFTDNCCPVED